MTTNPSCFGSRPGPQQRAENDCVTCPAVSHCLGLTDEVARLLYAAYPIDHDEGCMLDPDYGDSAFESYLDDMEMSDGIDNFDPDNYHPFCNCGAVDLNEQASLLLRAYEGRT